MTESVEFDEFVRIAYGGEVAQELAAGDDHRGAVVVGVERIGRESLQIPVQKQVYVALRVVDQPEGDTEPGRSPSQRSMRCSDANESLPCRRRRSRSWMARFCSQSNATR